MTRSARRETKRGKRPYTRGQMNKLIDTLVHPLYEVDEGFVWLDGVLHSMIERDIPLSMKKFLKYNAKRILKHLGENLR